jgi:hypothetical protein
MHIARQGGLGGTGMVPIKVLFRSAVAGGSWRGQGT